MESVAATPGQLCALSDGECEEAGSSADAVAPALSVGHTPVSSVVLGLRQKLEQSSFNGSLRTVDRTSPGLAYLRNTPSRIRSRQGTLTRKHQEAKNGSKKLMAGGGVSLWPEMDKMRLSREETAGLVAICCGLAVTTVALFYVVHGDVQGRLLAFSQELQQFSSQHQLSVKDLNTTVLAWHADYSHLLAEIQDDFDISLLECSGAYQLCVILYIVGILVLLLYLADNILSKARLTPGTIKIWVSLLVVMGLWTLLILQLFVVALQVEQGVTDNVHALNDYMERLVYEQLELQVYRDVMSYWRTRCLSPTSTGVLRVMGVMPIGEVQRYLQYYSWPVLTALLTPIAQLVWSLKQIYTVKVHSN